MKLKVFNKNAHLRELHDNNQKENELKINGIILSVLILFVGIIYFAFGNYHSYSNFTLIDATIGWFRPYWILTLDPNGGEVQNSEVHVAKNSAINELEIPRRTGYVFNGWFHEDDSQVDTTIVIYQDYNIHATWHKDNYTLTVNPNGGTWESSTSIQNMSLEYEETKNIDNPTMKGYTFDDWTLTGAGSTLSNATFQMGHENASLTANYHINTYKLTIEDSYTCDGEFEMDYDTTKTICVPSRVGYTFTGWDFSSGNLSDNVFTISDSDVVLKATWQANNYKWIAYHKTQDLNGSTWTQVDADTQEGEAAFDSTVTPTVKNYPGFISPSSKTITIQVDDYPPTKNVVTYEYNRFKGSITLDLNGGTYEGNTLFENVYYEETREVGNPSKTCHTFANWTVSGSGSSLSDSTITMGYENTMLTANYNINKFTVTYDANGGSVSKASDEVDCGTTLALPTPTLSGYLFTGWWTEASGGSEVTSSTVFTSSQKVYAHWQKLTTNIIDYSSSYTSCTNLACAINELLDKK